MIEKTKYRFKIPYFNVKAYFVVSALWLGGEEAAEGLEI